MKPGYQGARRDGDGDDVLNPDAPLRVGDKLYGYCGGEFGRDSYGDKRVEAIGGDWVVARETASEQVVFYKGDPEDLTVHRDMPADEGRRGRLAPSSFTRE